MTDSASLLSHPKLEKLLNLIRQAEVVSFDVFDTALIRPFVQPVHLFHLLDREARKLLSDPYISFKQVRMQAERNVRTSLWKTKGYEDITLDEIYAELAVLIPTSTPDILKKLQKQEVEWEAKTISAHPTLKAVFEFAKSLGKRIVFVSDMYLTSDEIADLLRANGYDGFEAVFVSGDVRKTKSRGTLFPHVLNALGVSAAQVVHIGDNLYADIKRGKENGLHTFWIPKVLDAFGKNPRNWQLWANVFQVEDKAESLTLGLIAAKYYSSPSGLLDKKKEAYAGDWQSLGYQIAGPLYLGFIQWLIDKSTRHDLHSLYFLARDGYIMKQVYDRVKPFYPKAPRSEYIYASRRALWIPRLDNLDSFTLNFLCNKFYISISVAGYLKRIGLKPEAYADLVKEAGLPSLQHIVRTDEDYAALQRFFVSIKDVLAEMALKERDPLIRYYKQYTLDSDAHAAIVDIGWNGSMQLALNDVLGRNASPLPGFYLGTYHYAKKLTENNQPVYSYLFELGYPEHNVWTLMECIEIIELLFSAPHGSLLRFTQTKAGIEPVLNELDIPESKLQIIASIHEGALAFVDDFLAKAGTETPYFKLDQNTIMKSLRGMLSQPTLKEVRMFEDLVHIMDIAQDEEERHIVMNPPRFFWLRPFALARTFKRVYWRKGFLAKLGPVGKAYFLLLAKTYQWFKCRHHLFGTLPKRIAKRLNLHF